MRTKTAKLLLLQAREPKDPMREHEIECFAERAEVRREQITPHDLLTGAPALREVLRYDAVMIGGAGEFYVSKADQPNFDSLLGLLRELIGRGHPTFATCYGFQSMVAALGGEIIHDPERAEVGTFELELTREGRGDPLFGHLPARFWAQQGHKDRAARLPSGVDNLALSERCPLQAMRVHGKPIWAVQFHPELDHEANKTRYLRYLDSYAPDPSDRERAKEMMRFEESPEASLLLRRFLDYVLE